MPSPFVNESKVLYPDPAANILRPVYPRTPTHTVAEALEFLVSRSSSDRAAGTIRMYAKRGGHVLRLLGEVDVNALSFDQVQDYVNRRLEEGAHKETVRKELCVLRKALKLAHARPLRRLDRRPCFPEFKRDYTPHDRYLTEAEFQALLPRLPPKRQLWVQVAVFSGLRLSELQALRWEQHIDLDPRWIRVPGTKTRKSRRVVPIADLLVRSATDRSTILAARDGQK